MGKKTKVGKQRKDKFYHLAKETGYRSRAAFKLIQLNRKFEFLQKSRVCIDLCAAPGGWMQVAKQNMPVSSVVIGVDLFAIKPVPGCIGLQGDITTDKCKQDLQKELQTWKADVVLHDGAPNVGKNWLHDAYQQSCLTLSALKLATQFLCAGGWFVTKVFRSKDYHPLIWVLKQLFKKVYATKPPASRTESAEIFVVCAHYLAPDRLDSRFLDHRHVFEDVAGPAQGPKYSVMHPERPHKVRAEGYAENDYTLHHAMPVAEFLAFEDAVQALQQASEIVLDDKAVADDPLTTPEIRTCCKDIKVLGRRELRLLVAWWKALRKKREEESAEQLKVEEAKEEVKKEVDEDEAEDAELQAKLAEAEAEEAREKRRRRRQANKLRRRLQARLDLKMVLRNDEGPREEANDMFSLQQVVGEQVLDKLTDQNPEVVAHSDHDSEDEAPQPKRVRFEKEGKEFLHKSGTFYTQEESESEHEADSDTTDSDVDRESLGLSSAESDEEDSIPQPAAKQPQNPLLKDLDPRSKAEKRAARASLWFEKDVFQDLDREDDEDFELDQIAKSIKSKGGRFVRKKAPRIESKGACVTVGAGIGGGSDDSGSDTDEETDNAAERATGSKRQKAGGDASKREGARVKKRKLDAEGLALGSLMVTSRRTKRDLLDGGWNRYAFNDENLPDWFVENERKFMQRALPVPQELVSEYQKRSQEVNVRPIKKVVEAKARKKKRALRRMDKAKKKVEAIMENVDVSEREKAKQIRQLYKKARGKRPEVTYIVAKKHSAAKRMRRPPGIKGPYRVVDPRMKKDLRPPGNGGKGGKGRGKGAAGKGKGAAGKGKGAVGKGKGAARKSKSSGGKGKRPGGKGQRKGR